ncbi:MAG: hypothetical protein JWO58_2135 [Chitinophagaceae bacterium]|nr:hypothetical protein [Chitinophagaceae bacterium]
MLVKRRLFIQPFIYPNPITMKKTIVIVSILLIGAFFLGSFIQRSKEGIATEEYALVDVFEKGHTKLILVSIGEKKYEPICCKTTDKADLTPVMRELNLLNREGFEIVNVSTTGVEHPRHLFMLKRKI